MDDEEDLEVIEEDLMDGNDGNMTANDTMHSKPADEKMHLIPEVKEHI